MEGALAMKGMRTSIKIAIGVLLIGIHCVASGITGIVGMRMILRAGGNIEKALGIYSDIELIIIAVLAFSVLASALLIRYIHSKMIRPLGIFSGYMRQKGRKFSQMSIDDKRRHEIMAEIWKRG
jgi:hypothetical protein